MSDMILAVRITADGAQLVGQLSNAETKALSLKGALGQAATGSKQLAGAADEATRATRGAAAAANDLAQAELSQGRAATEAARSHAQASQMMQSNMGRQRTAYQQLGFQAQDFFTQIAGGGNAFVAFSQQSGQAVGALQMLAGEGTAATSVLGRFAGFMAGPWGIAIGVALPIIGMLAQKLFDTQEAAQAAEAGATGLAAAQSSLGEVFDLVSGKLRTQNELLLLNARLTAVNLRAEALKERTTADQSLNFSREGGLGLSTSQRLLGFLGVPVQSDFSRGQRVQALADGVRSGRISRDQAMRQSQALNFEGLSITREDFQQALIYDLSSTAKSRVADQIDQSLDTGNLASGLGRPAPRGRQGPSAETLRRREEAEARRQAAAADRLADFGNRAADAIGRINDRWNEQPTLIDKARQDTDALNDLIQELSEKHPPNFAATIDSARAAQTAIQAGLLKPFNDMIEAGTRQRYQQLLVLQGREHEADVMARVLQLQDQGLTITAAQRAQIDAMVSSEEQINLLLDKREAIIGAYQQSIGDLRGSLEELLSGGSAADFGKSLIANAKRLQGQLLTEQLFGSGLREIEQRIRRETGLESAVDLLDRQTRATATSFDAVGISATRLVTALDGAANIASGVSVTGDPTFGSNLDSSNNAWMANYMRAINNGEDPNNPDIVVEGPRRTARPTLTTMPVNDYFREIARVLANPIVTLLGQIDDTMGTKLAGRLGGVIEGGIAGYMQGGVVMGALGALKGVGIGGKIGAGIDQAYGGAQTGLLTSQVGNMLGVKNSQTGAQIGGAIGSFLPIPGGAIIGSIAGGLFGGLFKKKPSGAAVISNADTAASTSGKLGEQLSGTTSSVQSALAQIADRLGGTLGNFSTSIGKYGDYYRVSASGSASIGDKKYTDRNRSDILYDGKNEAEAIAAMIRNAIADGGIGGLSAAMQKALASNSDVDKAVAEALKVQQVEELLGGLGFTMEKQFRTFETQAKDRLRIAQQYGFDVTAIEARNAEDRKKLLDQILGERVGALQQLLSDMTVGNLFEGSAADRRTALMAEVAKAKTDAEAGVDGAAQKLADLSRQLVETSRDAYGTAGPEYAADRTGAIASAEKVIALENERIKAAQDAAIGTKAALDENNRLTNESNDLLAQIATGLSNLSLFGTGSGSGLSADTSRQVDL